MVTTLQRSRAAAGVRLLNRTRRISLTEVGQAYYERCLQILADIDDAERRLGTVITPRGRCVSMRQFQSRRFRPCVAEFTSLYRMWRSNGLTDRWSIWWRRV